MINPNFFTGRPVDFHGLCKVYSPRISEILDDKDYPVYKKLLLNSQEDLEDEWVEQKFDMSTLPTPLEYIFLMSSTDRRIKEIAQNGFKFFLHEPVFFIPDQKKIILGDIHTVLKDAKSVEDLRFITEDNFFELQNLIRQSIGEKEKEPYNPDENPKIKYFKAKARLRDRVKAKSKDALNLGSTLAAICCMNFGINPLNIGELSQAAISVLIRYYQEKYKYDTDINALLAGADSKKIKPQTWIRNIEDL